MSSASVVSPQKPAPRKWLRRVGLLVLAGLLAGLGLEAGRVLFGRNWHEVMPGKVYRGAQPSAADLADLAGRHGIRTVVNLRGCCDPFDWYREESRATQDLNLAQEDINFSSGRLPSWSEVRQLVEVLERAEYPLFLHCRRGADRTGLASAIFLLLETDTPAPQARQQLGWRFGHLPVGRPLLLDHFFDLYADWLKVQGQEHSPPRFRHWLLHEYKGGGRAFQVEEFVPLADGLRLGRPCGFRLKVRNSGASTWRLFPGSRSGTQLGYNLRNEQDELVASGNGGLLDAQVGPGQQIDLMLVLPSLARPGKYYLRLDLLDQQNGWFFQTGSEPFEKELIFRE